MKLVLKLLILAIFRILPGTPHKFILHGILLERQGILLIEKGKASLLPKRFIGNLLPSLLIKRSKNNPSVFPEYFFSSSSSEGHIFL